MGFFILTSASGIRFLHLFHNAFCVWLIFGTLNPEISCVFQKSLPFSAMFLIFEFVIFQYNQCVKVSNFIFWAIGDQFSSNYSLLWENLPVDFFPQFIFYSYLFMFVRYGYDFIKYLRNWSSSPIKYIFRLVKVPVLDGINRGIVN